MCVCSSCAYIVTRANGVIMAESSAYDKLEWIDKLVAYVKDVAERIPRVKIIGKLTENKR